MRDKKDVTVDSVNYQIYPMSPLSANSVLVKMTKLFGKTLANFLIELLKGDDQQKKKALDSSVSSLVKAENAEAVAKAFIEFCSDVEEEDVKSFILVVLNKDLVIPHDGKMITVDDYFNKYGLLHLYKVLWEVLKVNYSDFLEGVAGNAG